MRRAIFVMSIIGLVLALPLVIVAQDTPATTPEPSAPQVQVTVTFPADGSQPANVPTVEAVVTAEPTPASPIEPNALKLLQDARADLDTLAIQNMGADRPQGWTGNGDITNVQLPILIRLDLELLAGQLLGPDQRPTGWFGAVPSTAYAIARDIRHDLELLADQVNPPSVRPPGWKGADPIMRCDRPVQTLIFVLERTASYKLSVDPLSPDFCRLAELQATSYAEANLLPNRKAASGSSAAAAANGAVQISSPYAVAFLDRFGRRPTGSIPLGETITPVARSYTQFSKMMLVRGNGFEVFIDFSASTVSANQFAALPDVNNVATQTSCTVSWCKSVP